MTELFDALRALRKAVMAPVVSITLVLGVITLAGFGALWLAWRGAAHTPYVPYELPFLVSGGLGGLALMVFGLGLLDVHANRVEAARRRTDTDAVLRMAVELIALAPARRRRSTARRSSSKRSGAGRSKVSRAQVSR